MRSQASQTQVCLPFGGDVRARNGVSVRGTLRLTNKARQALACHPPCPFPENWSRVYFGYPEAHGAFNGRPDPSIRHPGGGGRSQNQVV